MGKPGQQFQPKDNRNGNLVCTWKPAAGNEIKKKEKKDKLEVIGAPKKTEKYLMKKKKIKDDSSDNSSSSDSEDDDYNKRKTIVSIFIELKRLLESKNSPLTGSLMECLRVLLKDYKNEIDEILVADKQLQKELIYDIQKYESLKAKSMALGCFQ
ncbi:Condensin-2 complex subunit D3 [Camellia lanceoleosa]|uniref:Condensin-2 complex subunit D3 n=1 Tax=Camellia lanceoleosa TaxID=1840588 RepID=A0ACC0FKH4_9ERIC|nr:Condensin-2 complex subunit D3 [Camellia lanceoleosa]